MLGSSAWSTCRSTQQPQTDSLPTAGLTPKQLATNNMRYHIACAFTPKQSHCRFVKTSVNEMIIACRTLYILHQINSLLFSSLITIYYDALHRWWFTGWCNKPLRINTLHSDRRYNRNVAFDTNRLSLSEHFKSIIAVVPVRTVRIVMHAIF
jgi:hypothetical protein